jgi:hypothetical protein
MALDFLQSLVPGTPIIETSLHELGERQFILVRRDTAKYLLVTPAHPELEGHPLQVDGIEGGAMLCPLSHPNARLIRRLFPHTAPRPVGLKRSFGAGDRLGLAAPAHIRAARAVGEGFFALILAQQSMREMARTQRTPQEVLDAATWGAFEESFQQSWGADADHLKSESDVRLMAREGFTFFTIDPSEHVDTDADGDSPEVLAQKFEVLESAPVLQARYDGRSFEVPTPEGVLSIRFSTEAMHRASVKYARAVAHTFELAQVLADELGSEEGAFDLEMSVDETDSPTSVAEHFFIANELRERGVPLTSLALRFVGEFQKGIDYKGDLREFEARLKEHVAIAKYLGPYKISIHSGSDKFSIFPIAARVCGELLHEKTAGTWYLEALRVAARREPSLFRDIALFAREKFPTERATYHVTESLGSLADFRTLADAELESILDTPEGRQMLHVTFGSVLTARVGAGENFLFRERLYDLWRREEELHFEIVTAHSLQHMKALGMGDAPLPV